MKTYYPQLQTLDGRIVTEVRKTDSGIWHGYLEGRSTSPWNWNPEGKMFSNRRSNIDLIFPPDPTPETPILLDPEQAMKTFISDQPILETPSPIRPSHYSHPSGIECITVAQHHSFNIGNVFKYLFRAGRKPSETLLTDLQKAKQYIEFEITHIQNNLDETK